MAERNRRKVRTGRVVSDRMTNTVVVEVETRVRHPLYGRRIKRTKRYLAHNEGGMAKLGDQVRIMETRPLSKRKRWRVTEVLASSESAALAAEARREGLEIDVEAEVDAGDEAEA